MSLAHHAVPRPRRALILGRLGSLALALCAWLSAAQAAGEDAGVARDDAVVATSTATRAASNARDPRTADVRALLAGTLSATVSPQSLFDVPLTDPVALAIEAVRVRALLREVEQSAEPPPTPSPTPRGKRKATPIPTPTPTPAVTQREIAGVDAARWAARLQLDRARLSFYTLDLAARAAVLDAHDARRAARLAQESEADRTAREAAQRARDAALEREQALTAAREARSEAERVLQEEEARLLGVEQAAYQVRQSFEDQRERQAARRDALLGWQRRAKDARTGASMDADTTYDGLRRTLRLTRDELDEALDAVGASATVVPVLGPDRLGDLPAEISVDAARDHIASVQRLLREVRAEENALREERARSLLDEVTLLNRERLALLPYLTSDKRSAITGFTAAGLDHARSEGRQLVLILRYHKHVVASWLRSFRGDDSGRGVGGWRIAAVLIPWLFAALVFAWGRSRTPQLLALAEERVRELERVERRTTPTPIHKALQFVSAIHRPLEWLLFFGIIVWVLPSAVRALLEVEIITLVVGWSLAGTVIVHVINALAAGGRGLAHHDALDTLRLRSLRLVGRVVVTFILVLLISARLVSEGTVYDWVLSTCWLAAIPVFLVLVSWWREVVFERLERVRRKSPFQAWVLANRSGYKSFFAAMITAVQLFGQGAYKVARNWLSGFNLARRAHAYLFKRELDRLAGKKAVTQSQKCSPEALAALAPTAPSDAWMLCPADDIRADVAKRVSADASGLIALIGGRGVGKSTLFRRLAADHPRTVTLHCTPETTVQSLRSELTAASPAGEPPPRLILVDDVHAIVKPMLGGLQVFDAFITFAREYETRALWIVAIDSGTWPFLRRARDARPVFDETWRLSGWTDEQIGELLAQRSAAAGLTPRFDELVQDLPTSADEIDRQEALAEKTAGYYRMIWDYSGGNPAMALEVWRSSLGVAADGTVHVRPLQTPDATELETLPDSSLFVLRAVLQLEPATVSEVSQATRLTEPQVIDAFRFGRARGYLQDDHGKTQVSWPWLRAVLNILERRHLLVRK